MILIFISLISEVYFIHTHGFYLLAACTCVPAIAHKNNVFHFYQQNKSSVFTVMFQQANNRLKNVSEAVKLAYANKKTVYHFLELWSF